MHSWSTYLKYSGVIVFICLLGVAAGLRAFQLAKFQNIKSDEETWILSGISLLTTGQPETWTVFWTTYNAYHTSNIGGEARVVVHPYLDHPPLFQIFMGKWALITGNASTAPLNWSTLRLPMIFISLLTIALTSWLVYKVFSPTEAFLTLLSFFALPSHILASRIIASEHIIALCLITSLLLLWYWLQTPVTKQRHFSWKLTSLLLICSLAPLVKLSGIIIPLTIGLILLSKEKYFHAALTIFAMLLGLGLFVAYGCYYDCNLFWAVLQQHGLRPQTFWYFFTLFSQPDLGYYTLKDPMMILGLVGSLSLLLQRYREEAESKVFLLAPWLVLTLLFVTIAPIELYGWYKFIAFPLIAIGLGSVWHRLQIGEYGWSVLLLPVQLQLIENVFELTPSVSVWRKVIIGLCFLPVVIWMVNPQLVKKQVYQYWVWSVFGCCIVMQLAWAGMVLWQL